MAEMSPGVGLSLKQGQDMLYIQGETPEQFVENYRRTKLAAAPFSELSSFFTYEADAAAQSVVTQFPGTTVEAPAPAPAPAAQSQAPAAPANRRGGGSANADSTITEPQKKLIWTIADRVGYGTEDVHNLAANTVGRIIRDVRDLTKKEASTLIDALQQVQFEQG